ncbi:hypothetical protein N7493_008778 [Penicillium malachiteum]|uniref:U6 snRNA phosphodiesterase n=1 Tax=Penicillium malachiteum TaxID=1324776 RepID=A0AAD6MSS1_9EURO|nr:hypothetical protein N7493_008778 [Penicillium malachiteum]
MSLVQYSDSESEADIPSPYPPAKKPRHNPPASGLPPLPATFHDLYASSSRVSVQDDPSLHGGRKRIIPHIEGNWPTHLYLEWHPSKTELTILERLIPWNYAKNPSVLKVHSLLHSDLGAQLPLHISLSRPVVLRTEQRTEFTDALQNVILESKIAPFNAIPDTLKWVSNYERTRWFLVLHVQRPQNDNLNKLLRLCNNTLSRFKQPPLYSPTHENQASPKNFDDKFHISLAWTLTEPSPDDNTYVDGIDLKSLEDLHVGFDAVKVKVGNNVMSIPLPSNT